jgi:DEAD/DEAH box helicase domain-containing protein
MALTDLIASLRGDAQFMANVAAWRVRPAQAATFAPIPPALHPDLCCGLAARNIESLYSHQAEAISSALAGRNVVVVTPTASGKTLCYLLPTLNSLLNDPTSRALFLYPTKALAHDQLAEIGAWALQLGCAADSFAAPYDGDTPAAQRSRIRSHSRIILSNPDMLHMGILPFHPQWAGFFAGLRFIVIDELHTYRGVFGSHVANVLRRLLRICEFYGSRPSIICTSATIANPQELAQRLIEQPVAVIMRSGAPLGEKHVILYNPPMVDAEHGLRRSAVLEAESLAARCIAASVQAIVFGRSRLTTELLLKYLREHIKRSQMRSANFSLIDPQTAIRGYRGGYLPEERRAIEAGLRSGAVMGVVATNALELGIDIGQLQAAILCGYPGTIASAWQQMGRAGRTTEASLAILVATANPLDQYIVQHPEFLFERSPEAALINPDNLVLLVDQVRCAAFEMPFQAGDDFGACEFTQDVLDLLGEHGDLSQHGERWLWRGAGFPSRRISLRAGSADAVVIQEDGQGETKSEPAPRLIGEIDAASAQMLVHDGAIYFHEGQGYLTTRLDQENRIAHVTRQEVDFYTAVDRAVEVQVTATHDEKPVAGALVAHGDVVVHSSVVGYRRLRHLTHEVLDVVSLDYPAQTLETTAYWLATPPATQRALALAGVWFDSINDYGPNWQEQRERVRQRDQRRCTRCGAPEPPGRQHDVHHLRPFRTFGYAAGVNEAYREANRLENLVLVCRACHQRLEMSVRTRSGLDGLAYTLHNLAPLFLMCDRQDIDVHVMRGEWRMGQGDAPSRNGTSGQLPTIYIYERAAAGLGFSLRLFEVHAELLNAAYEQVRSCPCVRGCPACVGPVLENVEEQLETKEITLRLVEALR